LEQLQEDVLSNTTYGRQMLEQAKEMEEAINALQKAGRGLTREKLLDMVIHAPTESYQKTLVSLARAGMDYQFFQLLSERIDRARGDGRTRLVELRQHLLEWTAEVDKQIETHATEVRQLFNAILEAQDITQAMIQSLPYVDEFFVQELNQAMQTARDAGDLDKIGKLQKMVDVLQQASQPAPEVALIEELMDVPEDGKQKQTWQEILNANAEQVTPEFLNTLANLSAKVQESDDAELAARLKDLNRVALRFSMERNLNAA
jgi:hypothetical protein